MKNNKFILKRVFFVLILLTLVFASGCDINELYGNNNIVDNGKQSDNNNGNENNQNNNSDEDVYFTVKIDDDEIKVKAGELVPARECIELEGASFLGWFIKGEDTRFDFSTPINKDYEIESRYEYTYFTVTFDIDKSASISQNQRVKYGDKINTPIVREIKGYTFLYWYQIVNDEKVVFDLNTPIKEDINLFSKYEANDIKVTFDNDGSINVVQIKAGEVVSEPDKPSKTGYEFKHWECENVIFDFSNKIYEDITLVAIYEINKYTVYYVVDGIQNSLSVEYNNKVEGLPVPSKDGFDFDGWYLNDVKYDLDSAVTSEFTLVAKFSAKDDGKVHVEYDFGYDCYQTKVDLRKAYYKDFYDFLVSKGAKELKTYNINSFEDFDTFMMTFKYGDRNEMTTIGSAFGKYYLTKDENGVAENQPTSTFIGYIWKQGKYHDFIEHLVTFFAYWRTDEGYSQSDPHGNDFFYSNWASMVDTAKFFYFDGDTLQTNFDGIYRWFTSERVKYALDHIPGVGRVRLVYASSEAIELPTDITRNGYKFVGWKDNDNNDIAVATANTKVFAQWVEWDKLYPTVSELSAVWLNDLYNTTGVSVTADKVDTKYMNSVDFSNMMKNSEMYNKWLWLCKAIAEVTDNENMDPESEGFDWDSTEIRGFYLSNLCGLFTATQHTDTYLHTVSADYTNSELASLILAKGPRIN